MVPLHFWRGLHNPWEVPVRTWRVRGACAFRNPQGGHANPADAFRAPDGGHANPAEIVCEPGGGHANLAEALRVLEGVAYSAEAL